jgi:hypothetical protein
MAIFGLGLLFKKRQGTRVECALAFFLRRSCHVLFGWLVAPARLRVL